MGVISQNSLVVSNARPFLVAQMIKNRPAMQETWVLAKLVWTAAQEIERNILLIGLDL